MNKALPMCIVQSLLSPIAANNLNPTVRWEHYLLQCSFLGRDGTQCRALYLCSARSTPQYIHIRTKSSWHMLSTLLNQMKLVNGLLWQSNMHSTLDIYPRPARKEKMYHYIREAKRLLSWYTYILCSTLYIYRHVVTWPKFFPITWVSSRIQHSLEQPRTAARG